MKIIFKILKFPFKYWWLTMIVVPFIWAVVNGKMHIFRGVFPALLTLIISIAFWKFFWKCYDDLGKDSSTYESTTNVTVRFFLDTDENKEADKSASAEPSASPGSCISRPLDPSGKEVSVIGPAMYSSIAASPALQPPEDSPAKDSDASQPPRISSEP